MKKSRTNRKHKDTMFRLLFGTKEKLLELYNALEGADLKDPELISIETLESAVFNIMMDDLAFTVGDFYIILTEQQASINENMPLRMLLYVARVYEKILDLKRVHWRKRYPIPTPRFYVLYNGLVHQPLVREMKLSEAFESREEKPMLELTVKLININAEEESPVLEKSPTLAGYSTLVKYIRQYLCEGMDRDDAIKTAVNRCMEEGILTDFLRKHAAEVTNAMFRAYTMEDVIQIRSEEAMEIGLEKGLEKGLEEGEEKGIAEGLQKAKRILKLFKEGSSMEEIAQMCGEPLENVKELLDVLVE